MLRSSANDNREFDPKAFNVFGPKLVGMREVFQDYALESRFLTEEMQGGMPLDIPINLPSSQLCSTLLPSTKLHTVLVAFVGDAALKGARSSKLAACVVIEVGGAFISTTAAPADHKA